MSDWNRFQSQFRETPKERAERLLLSRHRQLAAKAKADESVCHCGRTLANHQGVRHPFQASKAPAQPAPPRAPPVLSSDLAGCAEREVGRFIYNRIARLMDAEADTPEASELAYLATIVSDVEEYGADGTDPDGRWPAT